MKDIVKIVFLKSSTEDRHIFQEVQLFDWFETNLFCSRGFKDLRFFNSNLDPLRAFYGVECCWFFIIVCFNPSRKMGEGCFLFFLCRTDFAIFIRFLEQMIIDFCFIILFHGFHVFVFLSFLDLCGFYCLCLFVNLLRCVYLYVTQSVLIELIFLFVNRFFHLYFEFDFDVDFKLSIFILKLFASVI